MKTWIVLAFATVAGATSWIDTSQLDQGYREMYNLQFDNAHRLFGQWEQAHPEDPMGPVSAGAASLFWEFDRLKILQSELFVSNQSFFEMQKPIPDAAVKQRFD